MNNLNINNIEKTKGSRQWCESCGHEEENCLESNIDLYDYS